VGRDEADLARLHAEPLRRALVHARVRLEHAGGVGADHRVHQGAKPGPIQRQLGRLRGAVRQRAGPNSGLAKHAQRPGGVRERIHRGRSLHRGVERPGVASGRVQATLERGAQVVRQRPVGSLAQAVGHRVEQRLLERGLDELRVAAERLCHRCDVEQRAVQVEQHPGGPLSHARTRPGPR